MSKDKNIDSRSETPVSKEESTFRGISHTHFKDKKFSQFSKLLPYVDTYDSEDGLENDTHNEVPVKSLRNGYYQEIFWLGCSGFIIFNHHDKEILLVDPWSSYCSFWNSLDDRTIIPRKKHEDEDYYEDMFKSETNNDLKRIEDLANTIRKHCNEKNGYTLSGILLSHMHFDHADDIPLLLELLVKPAGKQYSSTGLIFNNIQDNPIEKLPQICCDLDTRIYLKTHFWDVDISAFKLPKEPNYWNGKKKQKDLLSTGYFYDCETRSHADKDPSYLDAWKKIKKLYGNSEDLFISIYTDGNKEPFYDDTYTLALKDKEKAIPGTFAKPFNFNSFHIQPIIWDHMNTGPLKEINDELSDQKSGNCQRISAFIIQRRNLPSAKKTLIIGSAGGMVESWTSPLPKSLKNSKGEKLEVDVLLQAIQGDNSIDEDSWLRKFAIPIITPLILALLEDGLNTLKYKEEVAKGWEFITNNIKVNDFIAFSHWESFVTTKATNHIFKSPFNFNIVRQNIRILKSIFTVENKKILSNDGLFILGRCGSDFEYPFPSPNPGDTVHLNINMEVDINKANSEEKPEFAIGTSTDIEDPYSSFHNTSENYTDINQDNKVFSVKLRNSDIFNLSESLLRVQSKRKDVIDAGEEEWFGEDYKNINYRDTPYETEELLANIHIYKGAECLTGSSKNFVDHQNDMIRIQKGVNNILIRLDDDGKKIQDCIIDGITLIHNFEKKVETSF